MNGMPEFAITASLLVLLVLPYFAWVAIVLRGQRSRTQIRTLCTHAMQRLEEGALKDALSSIRRARQLANTLLAENDPVVAQTLSALAMTHKHRGEYAAAESLLLWALAILRSEVLEHRERSANSRLVFHSHKRQLYDTLDALGSIYEVTNRQAMSVKLRRYRKEICENEPSFPGLPASSTAGETTGTKSYFAIGWAAFTSKFRRHSIPKSSPENDLVNCMLFAPPLAEPGEALLVQVFALTEDDSTSAATERQAREIDDAAKLRGRRTLETEVGHGTPLVFHLAMPGLVVDEAIQRIVWHGTPQSVQFGVSIPGDLPAKTIIGTVTVSLRQVPIGHIKFKLVIHTGRHESGGRPDDIPVGGSCHRYTMAFVSYASKDRSEVLKRVQMLDRLHIRFFQDLLHLEPGERWQRALYRHIDDCDLFLLFWSSAARQSEWVRKEIRYAKDLKGGDDYAPPEIVPVVIEGPPAPDAPEELAHLHFDDYLLYFLPDRMKTNDGPAQ